MTEKRFELRNPKIDYTIQCEEISDNGEWITYGQIVDLLNEQYEEIEKLKSEINMLKTTIGRNEGYINRLLNKGEWNNTSDKEAEWLRNNTVWTQMPSNKRTYTRTD